jgi:UDP-2,4-diacetamido-2,4,6-trideoxy-beta-L-altropyranose hydrolase
MSSMTKLVIRVDGDSGNEAGMGHVFRSLAYARMLGGKIPNADIQFLMRSFPEGIQKVAENGYSITTLPPKPNANNYRESLQRLNPDALIIDTLGSTDELIDAARECSSLIITLDDLSQSARNSDIIINGIVWATQWLPDKFETARVYQGVEYLQLREQFTVANQTRREISSSIHAILISTGGADGREFTPQLMNAVAGLNFEQDIDVNVIIGPAFVSKSYVEKADQLKINRVRFHFIENTKEMAELLLQSDLALITGGTVMFESVACGTPAIIACSYEHQVPQADWFASRGIVSNLGYFPGPVDTARVVKEIVHLENNFDVRKQMSISGRTAVDGEGLFRVTEIICKEISARLN